MQQSSFDFQTTAQSPKEKPALTVTELTLQVKGLLEKQIGTVWVKGEISNYKPSSSGHLYFSLKDQNATISCAWFRSGQSRAKFAIKDGLEVLVKGKISVYAPRGSYQLIVDSIEPLGAGALQLAFEQLKQKLQSEGLFEMARKRPIPTLPAKVVLITSVTGAVLQDMLNVLGRRNAGVHLLVIPVAVQGEDAPPQIINALKIANTFNLGDVIVVARGGGSMEDLWCFNDEGVVRAVAASKIPVISAVGHEVDFTLCDFAADLRAPTPSAAAELVSKNRLELIEYLEQMQGRLKLAYVRQLGVKKQRLLSIEARLVSPTERVLRIRKRLEELELRLKHSADGLLPPLQQMLDEAQLRMSKSIERILLRDRHRVESWAGKLEALSPLKVLARGYTLVEDSDSAQILKSVQEAKPGKKVSLVFYDGKTSAEII